MNTETGQIYHGCAEIEAARKRGEPLEELGSDSDADMEAMLRRRAQLQATRQVIHLGKRRKFAK
jgi:hypothetical protein